MFRPQPNLHMLLIFLIFFLLGGVSLAQNSELRFQHLTMEDGLSQNSIMCILKDSQGFMWFGTEDGLNKYDGYDFTVYRNIPGDSNSISDNLIHGIFEDTEGKLWVSNRYGLDEYDPVINQWSNVKNYIQDNFKLDSRGCIPITKSSFLIGSSEKYLLFDTRTRSFSEIDFQNRVPTVVVSNGHHVFIGTKHGFSICDTNFYFFEDVTIDNSKTISPTDFIFLDNDVKVLSNAGLWGYNLNSKKLFYKPKISQQMAGKNPQFSVVNKHEKKVYSNYYLKGLLEINLNPDNESVIEYTYQDKNPFGINATRINSLFFDDQNLLWVGTYQGGINVHSPTRWKFKTQTLNRPFIRTDIRGIMKSSTGEIWVGAGSTFRINEKGEWKEVLFEGQIRHSHVIIEDIDESLWLGNYNDGLIHYDPKNNKVIKFYQKFSHLKTNLRRVQHLTQDINGNIWIASFWLYKMDSKTKELEEFTEIRLPSYLKFDSKNTLWVGTRTLGLIKYNSLTNHSYKYMHNDSLNSISSNWVTSVIEGDSGIIWAGTYGSGLNKLNVATGKFDYYNSSNGLPNDVVYGILKDDHGNLWISSNAGITKFNPDAETFVTFDERDGLQGREFNAGSAHRDPITGIMSFGGINGFNSFHPDSIKVTPRYSDIRFTKFQLFNQNVPIRSDEVLYESINTIKKMTFTHSQNVLSYQFAALNYSDRNQYAYKLEGFDEDWQYIGERRTAHFTNLNPGDYKLKVRGYISEGEFWPSGEASLNITVLPPWWRTKLAYFMYAISAIGFIWWLNRQILKRDRLKQDLKFQAKESTQIKEFRALRTKFFNNISHEFRTPLTLIKGPLDEILAIVKNDKVSFLGEIIGRNYNRLLSLINQLRDLSNIDTGKMKLKAISTPIAPFLREILAHYDSNSAARKIEFSYRPNLENIIAFIDRKHMSTVMHNLISNALKFTTEEGSILVSFEVTNHIELGDLIIKVSDNGIGIPSDQHDLIFERFHQVEQNLDRTYEGSGIGLNLAKELVELHHGEIRVDSVPGEGSEFTIILSLGKNHLDESEIFDAPIEQKAGYEFIEDTETSMPLNKISDSDKSRKTILIVEDNLDMIQYTSSILSGSYNIQVAFNGKEGIALSQEINPDVIISDVMMPEMDGEEMVRQLKGDILTSHIPIILLTGKADHESKLRGLELGAYVYLSKPFDQKELQLNVENLIAHTQLLQEKNKSFSKHRKLNKPELQLTSIDDRLMASIIEIVEENYHSENFDVDELVGKLAMSRSAFYTKINALTGIGAAAFLHQYRIERAAQFIDAEFDTITQIGYKVGYSDAGFFSKKFKQITGMSPTDYRDRK